MGVWRFLTRPRRWRHRERPELWQLAEDPLRSLVLLRWMFGGAAALVGPAAVRDGEVAVGLATMAAGVAALSPSAWRWVGRRSPRLGALLAWLDGWSWGRDRAGAVTAALALAELETGTTVVRDLLGRRLASEKHAVTCGRILAAGLRAVGEGRGEEAEAWLALVNDFDASVRPPVAHRLANELRSALALARGDHRAVLVMTADARFRATPWTRVHALLARRASGVAISPSVLAAATWVASPGDPSGLTEREPRTRSGRGPALDPSWTGCLSALRDLPPRPTRDQVRTVVSALERRLNDPETTGRWVDRARELGANVDPVGLVRGGCVRAAIAALDRAAPPEDPDPADVGELFAEVRAALADHRQSTLASLARELADRTRRRQPLSPLEEVAASLRLERARDAVTEADPVRRWTVFVVAWGPLVNHAVWLHNERRHRSLANALYRRQLREAKAVGHPEAVELLEKNLACGP